MTDWDPWQTGPGDPSGRRGGWVRVTGDGYRPSALDDAEEDARRAGTTAPQPPPAPEVALTATPQPPRLLRLVESTPEPTQPSRAELEDAKAALRRTNPRALLDAISDLLGSGRLRP